MKHIKKFLAESKYKRYQKPLEAAQVCTIARELADDRFGVVSFSNGVLCLSVPSSARSANLQAESAQIIESINKKLGEELVKRLRYKIQ